MKRIKELGFAVYALTAAAILTMGTTELVAQASQWDCWDPPLAIGTCPGDYSGTPECNQDCIEVYYQTQGICDPGPECCFCFG